MKTYSAFLLLACAALAASAQTSSPTGAGNYVATERGPFFTRWESSSPTNTPGGGTFIELATSLNYREASGAWIPSEEVIEAVPGGAIARRGEMRVIFDNNLASYGSIDLEYKSVRLRSHLLGLGYSDPSTGKAAFIAEVQDCQGYLASNTVVYPEAMPGIIITYRYTKSSLEQDIVIGSADALPAPESLGMNPETTLLQAFTEFVETPAPRRIPTPMISVAGEPLTEETLDWGELIIPRGWAFRLDARAARDLPVRKRWIQLEGGTPRQVLVEEIPLAAALRALNGGGSRGEGASVAPAAPRTRNLASANPQIPSRKPTAKTKTGKPMELAAASLRVPVNGFLIDYRTVASGSTNSFVLEDGMTYYVTGLFSVGELEIMGNAVVKMPVSSTAAIVATNVTCKTDLYRPAVFTASPDDAHGESLGGTLDLGAFYGNVGLDLSRATTPQVLSNLRFLHLSNAVAGADLTLKHSQVARCKNAFAAGSTAPVLHNVLLHRLNSLLPNSAAAQVTGINVTAHFCSNFLANTTGTIRLTNSLFAAVTNWQCATTETNASAFLLSDTGVFETAGAGGHYLPSSSPFLHAGTDAIDSALLASLRLRTTYPPLVYSNLTISADTTFYPQAERGFASPSPGFHYPPLDHVFGGVTANANVTFAPGTAVGWFRTSSGWQYAGHGITLADQKVATFDGRADVPAYWVRCSTVQEGVNGLWAGGYGTGGITGRAWPNIANSPELVARFTRFSALATDSHHYRDDYGWITVRASHCEFYGGAGGGYNSRQFYTNCLWEGTVVWLYTDWPDSRFTIRNGTMKYGILSPTRFSGGANIPVVIYDSAFDQTTIQNTSGANTAYNYNASIIGSNSVTPAGAGDMRVASFNWQTGPMGRYYLPANSWLVNTNVATADTVGLFHFTTQTSQAKEQNSRLDCGYHFVAVDGSGKPIDTDGDGIPDVGEDINGDGLSAGDPTSWLQYESQNGLGGPSWLKVFTPLR